MCTEWTTLTPDNLETEHLCCIIRSKVSHPGVEAKRRWLADRLPEGHVFRKLAGKKATVFIEYAPLETAWVPIVGDNYLYIYCLWVTGEHKGKGYGRAAMERALEYIRQKPFGDFSRVALTCSPENELALKLYRSMGFAETGRRDEDEIELALTL